jgi:hypothetical protein
MKKLIMSAALGASLLALSACGDRADDSDTATAEMDATDTAATTAADTTTTASADWPKGTRIVQEGDTYYRIDPNGTRVAIPAGTWRIETVDGVRYRIDNTGARVRIDDQGLDVDLDGPDVEGVDVDLGTNRKGNLDLDVSTDGTDASKDDR